MICGVHAVPAEIDLRPRAAAGFGNMMLHSVTGLFWFPHCGHQFHDPLQTKSTRARGVRTRKRLLLCADSGTSEQSVSSSCSCSFACVCVGHQQHEQTTRQRQRAPTTCTQLAQLSLI